MIKSPLYITEPPITCKWLSVTEPPIKLEYLDVRVRN